MAVPKKTRFLTKSRSYHYFEKSTDLPFVQKIFDQKLHTMLRHRDKFGRRVYIYRPGWRDLNSEPSIKS